MANSSSTGNDYIVIQDLAPSQNGPERMAKRSFPIPPWPTPLPLERIKVYPLEARKSLTTVEQILVPPETPPPSCSEIVQQAIQACARKVIEAREKGAAVML